MASMGPLRTLVGGCLLLLSVFVVFSVLEVSAESDDDRELKLPGKPGSDCVWSDDVCEQEQNAALLLKVMMVGSVVFFVIFTLIFGYCLYRYCCLLRHVRVSPHIGTCPNVCVATSTVPTGPAPIPMPPLKPQHYQPPPTLINLPTIPENTINPYILGPPPAYSATAPPEYKE